MVRFVNAIRKSISDKNWYSALALALALPDICGRIEDKTLKSGQRYSSWFNRYVKDKYTFIVGVKHEQHIFMTGNDCYALRCAYLHQGEDITEGQKAKDIVNRFQFIAPIEGLYIHCNGGTKLQLQVDVFCNDICDGVMKWVADSGDKYKDEIDMLIVVKEFKGGQILI